MIALPRLDEGYARRFSPETFREKSQRVARTAGRTAMEKAFALYYAMRDAETPTWAKTTIAAALGYFIVPLDAIVDFVPGAGYADDLGMILLAFSTVALHIKQRHLDAAQARVAAWFDKQAGEGEASEGSS